MLGDSTQIRAALEHFMTTHLHCTLFFGRDLLGEDIRRVQVTRGKAYRINHLLAALRSFYQLLIAVQFYPHPHPLDLQGTKTLSPGFGSSISMILSNKINALRCHQTAALTAGVH